MLWLQLGLEHEREHSTVQLLNSLFLGAECACLNQSAVCSFLRHAEMCRLARFTAFGFESGALSNDLVRFCRSRCGRR